MFTCLNQLIIVNFFGTHTINSLLREKHTQVTKQIAAVFIEHPPVPKFIADYDEFECLQHKRFSNNALMIGL